MGKKQLTEVTTKKTAKKAVPSVSTKLTLQQKKFCKSRAKGKSATQAAIDAGYSPKTARQQGSRLLTNANIKQTVDKYAEKAQEKFDYTLEQQFNELVKAGEFAKQTGNASAFLSSVVQKGKLCGLYVERVKADVSGSISSFSVNSFLEKFNAEK